MPQPVLHAAATDVKTRLKLEGGRRLVMHTEFQAAGDQPTAIAELTQGIHDGERDQDTPQDGKAADTVHTILDPQPQPTFRSGQFSRIQPS